MTSWLANNNNHADCNPYFLFFNLELILKKLCTLEARLSNITRLISQLDNRLEQIETAVSTVSTDGPNRLISTCPQFSVLTTEEEYSAFFIRLNDEQDARQGFVSFKNPMLR
jgi:hypothetical protein